MSFRVDLSDYDMPCSIQRKVDVKSSSLSGDLLDGSYFNDVIGTYLSYDVTVAVPAGQETTYDALHDVLTNPDNNAEHDFEFPYGQGTKAFRGRVESVSDKLYRQEGTVNIWRGISFSVTSTEPIRTVS